MGDVEVIIFHRPEAPGSGRLERALAAAREANGEALRFGFLGAGAQAVRIDSGEAGERDDVPFGSRLRAALASLPLGYGLVVLGSGAIPLAVDSDRRAFVEIAEAAGAHALANNRYSADVIALSAEAAVQARDVPPALPGDNALPRWLEEIGGVDLRDLRRRWRLAVDLDSPLDVLLVARSPAAPAKLKTMAAGLPDTDTVTDRIEGVRSVLGDPRAEVVIAGRTSAGALAWLERNGRCRVRALVEERGLRASTPLAQSGGPARPRNARSVLGLLLDRDGPGALGELLAELGDAALVDSRVLVAHQLGADESRWPRPEDRFASDLLDPSAVRDPWLAALTASAAAASIPIVLGGHSLVGPGVRLVAARARSQANR